MIKEFLHFGHETTMNILSGLYDNYNYFMIPVTTKVFRGDHKIITLWST